MYLIDLHNVLSQREKVFTALKSASAPIIYQPLDAFRNEIELTIEA